MDKLFFSSLDENTNTKNLVIYIEPVAKQRPRFTKNGHVYTPAKTKNYEDAIAMAWRLRHKKCSTADLNMRLLFYVPIPKSMSKKDRERAIKGELRPSKKNGDLDNYIKAVMDGLNEVAYFDDKQVVGLQAYEFFGETPRVEIEITELLTE